uniref:Uncharacterized protein n=1 Tax=Anopheles farauti TaxID=69004 RepID=A0A182QZ72_9DIPT
MFSYGDGDPEALGCDPVPDPMARFGKESCNGLQSILGQIICRQLPDATRESVLWQRGLVVGMWVLILINQQLGRSVCYADDVFTHNNISASLGASCHNAGERDGFNLSPEQIGVKWDDDLNLFQIRVQIECQNLIEENRRLVSIASGGGNGYGLNGMLNGGGSGSLSTLGMGVPNGGSYTNVESVILQTQVETLQWQLKQVDSSRHMYRAVMEEPSSLTLINNSSASQHAAASAHHEDECVVPPSPASSYSNFRDFTWRRSPKRTQTLPISSNEVDPEKLAQEAFRLLRTVQNLLNTQEPTLAQSTNALDSLISASTAASSCGSSTTLTGVGLSASGAMLGSTPTLTGTGVGGGGGAGGGPGGGTGGDGGDRGTRMSIGGGMSNVGGGGGGVGSHPSLVNTRSTVGFNRKLNMRGSRLSVRSSTADSVHSTSSSTKTETDEDNTDRPSPPLLLSHHHHHHHHLLNHHSAEDESGFSSMNSFQEIGLPLVNSTMLSSVGSSHGVSNGSLGGGSSASSSEGGTNGSSNSGGGGAGTFGVSEDSSELRENTVIPTTTTTTVASSNNNSANKLGIPSSPSIKAASTAATTSTCSSGNSSSSAVTTTASSASPLRATQTASYEHHTHFINHRRWDSAPVVPPKLKIHAGETDTVSRVLWV